MIEPGDRFGKLTVIGPAPHEIGAPPSYICRCDCGNEKVVLGGNLRSGNTRSCGCLRRTDRLRKLLDSVKSGDFPSEFYETFEKTFPHFITDEPMATSSTNVRGVSSVRGGSQFLAYIGIEDKRHKIGYFYDLEDARKAREMVAEIVYHPFYVEFRRPTFPADELDERIEAALRFVYENCSENKKPESDE